MKYSLCLEKFETIRNLGNFHIRGPHIVMSRTIAQNGHDFHFNDIMRCFDSVWRSNLIAINMKIYTETYSFGFFTENRIHNHFLRIHFFG
jgi:hypothetical protein